jgi:hypothetical protein
MVVEAWQIQITMGEAVRLEAQDKLQFKFKGSWLQNQKEWTV